MEAMMLFYEKDGLEENTGIILRSVTSCILKILSLVSESNVAMA